MPLGGSSCRHCRRSLRRRPAGPAQCAGACGRAGARGRQQHRAGRDRAASWARCWRPTGARNAAGEHDGARHVGGDASGRHPGAALRPADRLPGRDRCSGVLTGLICCAAVLLGSFLLLNVGALFSGFYAASHNSYRFAAADTASEDFRPNAISWVMAGGSLRGHHRIADCHLHQGSVAALSLRRDLSRAGHDCARLRRRAPAGENPQAAAAPPPEPTAARSARSRASRASSWRSRAGSRATR